MICSAVQIGCLLHPVPRGHVGTSLAVLCQILYILSPTLSFPFFLLYFIEVYFQMLPDKEVIKVCLLENIFIPSSHLVEYQLMCVIVDFDFSSELSKHCSFSHFVFSISSHRTCVCLDLYASFLVFSLLSKICLYILLTRKVSRCSLSLNILFQQILFSKSSYCFSNYSIFLHSTFFLFSGCNYPLLCLRMVIIF